MASNAPEPSMQLLAEAAQNETRGITNGTLAAADRDDRSSSLSDLDDQHVSDHNEESLRESEAEDTEAETERLEESPLKNRMQKQVVVSGDLTNGGSAVIKEKAFEQEPEPVNHNNMQQAQNEDGQNVDEAPQTSDISSLGDSADASELETHSSSSSRKRKRDNDDDTKQSLKKVALELANHVADQAENKVDGGSPSRDVDGTEAPVLDEVERSEGDADQSSPEGNPDEERTDELPREMQDVQESNDEDVDMEDAGNEADAVSSARSEEEMVRKRAAIDMLSKIEANFAVLRDKLFAEKNTQLTEELATMQSGHATHPEYLAMVDAIDHLRTERLRVAQHLYNYKVQALQNRSQANRAQAMSQYVQAARQIRETVLDDIGKEWYQIQRGRRRIEEDENDAMNHFSGTRMDHIAYHTAYNTEVSILSGIAKYVGFPAAPSIEGGSQAEVEDDLRQMGISRQQINAPIASSLNFSRQRPAAEEQFLENTPWANPSHPIHMMNNSQRQSSNQVRSTSPFATPVTQKRATEPQMGSASTIPAIPSSSLGPTPHSTETSPNKNHIEIQGETPSKLPVNSNGKLTHTKMKPPSDIPGRNTVQHQAGPDAHTVPTEPVASASTLNTIVGTGQFKSGSTDMTASASHGHGTSETSHVEEAKEGAGNT